MEVSLRKVTVDNIWDIINLRVSAKQTKLVAPNAVSLAQARLNDKAWCRGIYAGDTPVGFVMLAESPEGELPNYFLWRLMIAEGHQGKGYGRQAMEQIINHVKALPRAFQLGVSYVPGPGGPEEFYRKLGFQPTGEMEEDEVDAVLSWGEVPPRQAKITLRPVTKENLRVIGQLEAAESQKGHVISNIDSMAESLVHPHLKLWGVFLDEDPVGFAMLEEDSCKDVYFLWRLMIAKEHQGRGYGKQAMEAVIEYLRRRTDAEKLRTSCLPGAGGPESFYLALGFQRTQETLEDEAVLSLDLNNHTGPAY